MSLAALPATAPYRRPFPWSAFALFLGLLSLAAVEQERLECRGSDVFLRDGYGFLITDGFGRPITLGRERKCQLVAGYVRVPWPV